MPNHACAPLDADLSQFPQLSELRELLRTIKPGGTLRCVVVEIVPTLGGRGTDRCRILDAVLDVDGNLMTMALGGEATTPPGAQAAINATLDDIGAELDRLGWEGRDGFEVILDADGGQELRLVLGVEVSREELLEVPRPPTIHDGSHHVHHRAFELDALRDRVRDQRLHPVRRWARRLRAGITRRD